MPRDPHRRPRREARWFVTGDAGASLAPRQPGRRRVDCYHLPSLAPDASVKWRGDAARVEHKRRLGRVELVTWCGVHGFAEEWVKQRQAGPGRPDGGAWCEVVKEVWVNRGVELARLEICGDVLWTVCVDPADGGEPSAAERRAWTSLLAGAEPASYAAFLAAHPARRPTPRSVGGRVG